jgi:hypothetical protein
MKTATKSPTPNGAGGPNQPVRAGYNRSLSRTATSRKSYKIFGFFDLKIFIVIIGLAGPLGFFGTEFLGKPGICKIDWDSPERGGSVTRTNKVEGTIYQKPDGFNLWIIEHPSFGGVYAKQAPVKKSGKFSILMPFGDENHSGCTFQVYGMLLPEGVNLREMDDIKTAPKGLKLTGFSCTRL